jgi:NAD(P)-dependent dehydrogenase (short-subunit alcohol dehydrogenase family)
MSETPRVVLVTGSTDGIGKETALGLARAGAHVIVHGRSRPKVDAALADLQGRAPEGAFEGVSFDLGSLASIRKGAAQLAQGHDHLDVLVNNAGIFSAERVVTGDGIEATFAVNHVGPFLLTALLAPLLGAATRARIINVSSVAHTRGRIHLADLSLAHGYTGYGAYAQSKLANVMHARSIAERNDPDRLLAWSLHPGTVSTKLLREGFGPVRGASPVEGARTSIMLALADEPPGPSGSYFAEGRLAQPAAPALDAEVSDALWSATERLAGLG